jgi:lycopene cyclase domain-containing protein
MIPEKLEYLFLLALYFSVILTLLWEPALRMVSKPSFWFSCAIFSATWALIEIYALNHRWWVFSADKICGIFIASVPIEEYGLFTLFHLSVAATWSVLESVHDVA